ncbi:MAG: 2-hydroxyacid dehydrogenase [Thermoproteus sp. AZ2]|uniref:2-hydroxyacid dehydrogenase n=1 Tax=Thermoproteus sp. AZ2 TaxID=1609232 RepID=A0ACC6UYD3_9CREN|nr:MAG: 2-ketogluconate reductase [Thermoproteus sp. AZ2]
MPCIFVSRDQFPSVLYEKLRQVGELRVYPYGKPAWLTAGIPKDELKRAAEECDAMVVYIGDRVDAEVLSNARVKIISTVSVGYDHIDVAEARRRGIVVTNTPEVLVDATADLAVGILLALVRRIVEGDRLVREGKAYDIWGALMGSDLRGKRAGIVGLGNLGTAIAKRLLAFGAEVVYWSRNRKPQVEFALGIKYVDLDELLATSDFVILAVSLAPETRHLMNWERFQKMKRGAYLINVARGAVVDTEALIRALKEGILAGAALDVFEVEPLPHTHELTKFPNVVLTPHIGSAAEDTRRRMAEIAAENVVRFFRGERPLYVVA